MIENDFEAKQSVHIYIPAAAHQAAGLQAAVLQCCYYGLATAQGTGDTKARWVQSGLSWAVKG